MRLKAKPYGYDWPKGKKCKHDKGKHTFSSSAGWGCPTDREKTVCKQCGALLKTRRLG